MGYYSKKFYGSPSRPDEKWLGIKGERKYYKHLTDLAFTLQSIFPDLEISNRYDFIEQRYLSKIKSTEQEYYWLYKLLLRGMTKLHYRNRVRVENSILVAKDDVLLTLSLLQPMIWPQTLIGVKTKQIYQELILCFYPNNFRVYQAVRKLRIAKSTLQRHLVILEKCRYIERVGGDRKKGYTYNVGSRSL